MAHLTVLRESVDALLGRISAVQRQTPCGWRAFVPTDCPLCSGDAKGGGLCALCVDVVTASMHCPRPRCSRCCLRLDAGQEVCADCLSNAPAFDRIIAAFDYDAPGDLLVHRFKVARRFEDAPMLGGLLADAILRSWPHLPAELVLVPVPAGKTALVRRGFNPAAEVARVLARRLGRPCRAQLLRRVREGSKQATLGRTERMMSTSRLYQAGTGVAGTHIAVVDDVMTTGSTMHAIAHILKRSGALSVHGLVLARTPRAALPFF